MSGPLSIDAAFSDVPDLRSGIRKALIATPQYARLFDDISKYVLRIKSQTNGDSSAQQPADEPPSKKRRIDNSHGEPSLPLSPNLKRVLLEAREISFVLPQRKKLVLGIVQYGSSLNEPTAIFAIQGRNPATNQVEFEYPTASYAYALRLPVPEKNQKQYNFCLLPPTEKSATVEPLIWTVNHGALKSSKVEDPDLAQIAPGPEDVLENALSFVMEKTGVRLVLPSEKEFASAIRESHRKNDVAYHVKSHRGSKEGYLFFLESGIFFGFRKPLSFFSFSEIDSISYTSVLQRTFNLNITVRLTPDSESQDVEFSMLDQQDFAGIDTYVKNHQLQDASLAEARRAKKASKIGKAETNGGEEDDGKTELERAQQEMEDEEDEMEEDYDPGEDEDESGSESDSDEEEQEYTRGKGRNLIAEELGSEAEDVSVTEEEGEEEEGGGGEGEEQEEQEKDVEDEVDELHKEEVSIPTHPVPKPLNAPDFDDEDQL